MANANDLQTQIEIWKYANSDNAGGTPVEALNLLNYKYAKVTVNNGSTQNVGLGNLPYTEVDFLFRYDSDIDYKCQIKYNNCMYKINHIEIIDRNAWMKCKTVVYNELM